jgi:hypothetical protein
VSGLLSLAVAPPLPGTLWVEESVVLGAGVAVGVGTTLVVASQITEIVELIA